MSRRPSLLLAPYRGMFVGRLRRGNRRFLLNFRLADEGHDFDLLDRGQQQTREHTRKRRCGNDPLEHP